MQGDEVAATGLAYVTDLMIRSKMIEGDLQKLASNEWHKDSSELVKSMLTSTVKLYIKIYEYQIRIIRHYGGRGVTRFLKDVVGTTHWKALQQEMETIDKEIATKQQVLCNDIALSMREALAEFDAKNMKQHAATLQATKVCQIQSRNNCVIQISSLIDDPWSHRISKRTPASRTLISIPTTRHIRPWFAH